MLPLFIIVPLVGLILLNLPLGKVTGRLSVLLALLEMAKMGELRIAQARPFGSVEIVRDAVSEAA